MLERGIAWDYSMRLARQIAHLIALVVVLLTQTACARSGEDLVFEAQEAYSSKRFEDALSLYRQAADKGSSVASFQIGTMYERGEGVKPNMGEAVRWYEKAAERGSAAAAKRLAILYYDGEGVEKSPERVIKYYWRAGELGGTDAYFTLGQILWSGRMGPRDPAKAMEAFRKAAERGDAAALNALGIGYDFGDGVARDKVEALAYFAAAQKLGSPVAGENLEKLEAQVSPADRQAGKQRAQELLNQISRARVPGGR